MDALGPSSAVQRLMQNFSCGVRASRAARRAVKMFRMVQLQSFSSSGRRRNQLAGTRSVLRHIEESHVQAHAQHLRSSVSPFSLFALMNDASCTLARALLAACNIEARRSRRH